MGTPAPVWADSVCAARRRAMASARGEFIVGRDGVEGGPERRCMQMLRLDGEER
jgi:hypothetical protein